MTTQNTPASSENLFAKLKDKAQAAPTTAAAEPVATPEPPPAPAEAAAAPVPEPVVEAVVEEPAAPTVTELDMLKSRAALLGIKHSPNIGLDALKAKVKAKMEGEKDPDEKEEQEEVNTNQAAEKPKTLQQMRDEMRAEQMKLVRVRITNLNPSKKDLPGEILTFANRILGSVRKFIPYGEATDNGFHIPFCLYTQIKEREFVSIRSIKDSNGRTRNETKMAREFALEVLDPLTDVEIARLAASQAAAGGVGD